MILSLECTYCAFKDELILGGEDCYVIISTANLSVFRFIFAIGGKKSQVGGTWKITLQTPQRYYLLLTSKLSKAIPEQ